MATRSPGHRRAFPARFRRRGLGWTSRPAVDRVRQAVTWSLSVAREDPLVAGEGTVAFLDRVSPALKDVDSASVTIGSAVNLVFAKPVYSYVKFWQMLGRGTRVLEVDPARRKPWCPEKASFLVFDGWGNFDFFKMNPEGREPGAHVPLPVRLFRARLDQFDAATSGGDAGAAGRVIGDLRRDLAALPANDVVVSEHRAVLADVAEDGFWRAPDAKSR